MIAAIPSAVLIGVDGQPVSVEVHVSNGIPGFTVVGLPDAAVRELARSGPGCSAVQRAGLASASGHRQPGTLRGQEGRRGLDLPIAIGLLGGLG